MTEKEKPQLVVYTPEMRARDSLRAVMQTRSGRRFVYSLLEDAGFMQTSFHQDAMVMAFNEGRRNHAIKLYSEIDNHCPEFFQTMMAEAKEDKAYDDQHRRESESGEQ